ncbi:MAG: RluA family pseudouridine synthase [Alphaproteobacteria bacterium]|nr:RluA family pseudouridine synthase [Alphaproteobacteria bacterium]MBP7759850.1 RluA family pseudouridine synthase [Alphaproteobacteria bacterium]MBP7763170.1 RluA family pseudouridine synthase [Alphaproteobacteria bacterium]MBP7904752.1 RluA family pseudouridine synthase [Alphaproteobacteria bacterium]
MKADDPEDAPDEESGEGLLEFTVPPELAGQRADKALASLSGDLSRTRLQALMEEGKVFLNETPLMVASHKMKAGDAVTVHLPPPVACVPEPENLPLDIVYQDEDLLVINKAAGMVVHPGAGNWTGTLVNALLYHCAGSLSGIGGVVRPGIVHRLDKETSGLMIVAKNDKAHRFLAEQLSDRSLSRTYYAVVLGVPFPIKGVVDRPIGRDRNSRLKMGTSGAGLRDARTHYHVQAKYKEACSLVQCELETGRTHQIRVHMQVLGHPLVGDPLYGPQKTALVAKLKKGGYEADEIEQICEFPRQALHAAALRFIHPRTEEEMAFEAPPPADFSKLLKILDK